VQVLLADKDTKSRRLLGAFLERLGAQVLEVADGQHALDLFTDSDADRFALLMTSLELPYHSGFDLVQSLPGELGFDALPIILTSDKPWGGQLGAVLRHPNTVFMVKPVSPITLYRFIDQVTGTTPEPSDQSAPADPRAITTQRAHRNPPPGP
jgi:DNA-binding response OmpR family regulator